MRLALVGPELEENLGLRYLHASAVNAGREARIFNFHSASQVARLSNEIRAWDPGMVGLSMVFTSRAREFVDLAEHLRAGGYRGYITAGGHFASFHADRLLVDVPSIDFVVHGEGERVLTALLDSAQHPEHGDGVSWRDASGAVRTTPSHPLDDDLDTLPWPTRTPPYQKYLGKPVANILGSRGCYGRCNFCSIAAWFEQNGGKRFRRRSERSIAAEMAALYHEQGVRIFNFHDDNFFAPREEDNCGRFSLLERELDAAGVSDFAIQVKARVDSITPKTLRALKRIGLFRVFLGVENNSPSGLRCLGKGTTVAQNGAALSLLRREGIHTSFNLLMFGPDTTMAEIEQNIACIRAHRSIPLNFGRTEVYSGTPLEKMLRAQGRLRGTYFGYHYEIADPAVQRLFEMFRMIFTERNFLGGGMNLEAMRLDYHYHVLRHFYPDRARGLRGRAERLVSDLNLHSAMLLDELSERALGNGAVAPDQVHALRETRREYDRKAQERFSSLVKEIEGRAARRGTYHSFARETVAAAAAAAIAVTVNGCITEPGPGDRDRNTIDVHGTTVFGEEETTLILQRISQSYRYDIDSLASRSGYLDSVVMFNMTLDSSGAVRGIEIVKPVGRALEGFTRDLGAAAAAWTFPGITREGSCSVTLVTSYVRITEQRDWSCVEMIAYPVPLDSTAARLDSADLSYVVATIDSCYKDPIDSRAGLSGYRSLALTLRLTIRPDGSVATYEVTSPEGSQYDHFKADLYRMMKDWKFPLIRQSGWCEVEIIANPRDWIMCEMISRPPSDTTEFDTADQVLIYNTIMNTYRNDVDSLGRATGYINRVLEWRMQIDEVGNVISWPHVSVPCGSEAPAFVNKVTEMIYGWKFPGLSRAGQCHFNMVVAQLTMHMCEMIALPLSDQ